MQASPLRIPLRALALAGLFSGCASIPPVLAVRDAEGAKAARKVAVMPFFIANDLSAEALGRTDGLFRRTRDHWSGEFMLLLSAARPGRYELVCCETVEAELVRQGAFERLPAGGAPAGWRTGFTVDDALKAAQALGADAVLLGAGATADTKVLQREFVRAASVRLLDARSGRVLWGAAAVERRMDSRVLRRLTDKLKEAP